MSETQGSHRRASWPGTQPDPGTFAAPGPHAPYDDAAGPYEAPYDGHHHPGPDPQVPAPRAEGRRAARRRAAATATATAPADAPPSAPDP
ncbi:hypothetical protein AB0D45_34255, partial [Streptomyces sp. NPDC048352]